MSGSGTGTHMIRQVGGISTELYLKKSETNKGTVFVMIAGNPGLVNFYEEFLDHLHGQLGSAFPMLAVGHAGHCAQDLTGDSLFTLEDQIQHKQDLLALVNSHEFTELEGNNYQFVLMGHSIGSYIALKVKHREREHKVKAVVNLFPTVRNLWDGLDTIIKVLISPGIRHSVAALGHYCPRWVLQGLAERATATPRATPSFMTSLMSKLHYYSVLNCLFMAKIESVEVVDIDEEIRELIEREGENLIWIYSHKDPYTPLHFPEEMKEEFPNTTVVMTENTDVEHAFVVKHSKEVAEQLFKILQDFSSEFQ